MAAIVLPHADVVTPRGGGATKTRRREDSHERNTAGATEDTEDTETYRATILCSSVFSVSSVAPQYFNGCLRDLRVFVAPVPPPRAGIATPGNRARNAPNAASDPVDSRNVNGFTGSAA